MKWQQNVKHKKGEEESTERMRTSSWTGSFTGTKLWARRENHCHDGTVKGTGAAVETGSVSLYGLKTSQPQFPSTTYFYFDSESASHSAPFPCSTLYTHLRSQEAASKPVHAPGTHQGSKLASRFQRSEGKFRPNPITSVFQTLTTEEQLIKSGLCKYL